MPMSGDRRDAACVVVERSPFAGELFCGTNIRCGDWRYGTIDVVLLISHGRIFIPCNEGLA